MNLDTFWWGWLFGVLVTGVGVVLVIGSSAIRHQYDRMRRRRDYTLTNYSINYADEFFKKLHKRDEPISWFDGLPNDDEVDEEYLKAGDKLFEELEEQEHGRPRPEQR
jgi:hypothetical protein